MTGGGQCTPITPQQATAAGRPAGMPWGLRRTPDEHALFLMDDGVKTLNCECAHRAQAGLGDPMTAALGRQWPCPALRYLNLPGEAAGVRARGRVRPGQGVDCTATPKQPCRSVLEAARAQQHGPADCDEHEHEAAVPLPRQHSHTGVQEPIEVCPKPRKSPRRQVQRHARGQGAVCASLHGTEADHPECSGRHRVDGPNGCQNAECKGREFCVRSCSGCPDAKSARETRARLDLCERYYKERLVPLPASDELKAQW